MLRGKWLTIGDVAERLDYGAHTIKRLEKDGLFADLNLGRDQVSGVRIYTEEDVEAMRERIKTVKSRKGRRPHRVLETDAATSA